MRIPSSLIPTVSRRARWALPLVGGWLLAAAPVPATPPSVPVEVQCSPTLSRTIPRELERFVDAGARPVCAQPGDVNADGAQDFVLVTERVGVYYTYAEQQNAKRALLVLVREPDRSLRLVARSDHAVMCSRCGGVFGDPFEGVETEPGAFTVNHYGGSAWRWREDYTFAYVPSAGTWRLAKVKEVSYWTGNPDKIQQRTFTTPGDFGAITLADFRPETWNPRAEWP
jgi:hypothetical protein